MIIVFIHLSAYFLKVMYQIFKIHHLFFSSRFTGSPFEPNVSQICRHVDIGDQGVNDARWFQDEAILVTASGTGRWVGGAGHMYLDISLDTKL